MKKIFHKLAAFAKRFGAKAKRELKEIKAVALAERPVSQLRGRDHVGLRLMGREYRALNGARRWHGWLFYPHSMERLRRLARKHVRVLRDRRILDKGNSARALERILLMAESRQTALGREARPKKWQRALGLLPALTRA